jgi:cytochrome c-type biogenesis protein CcmH/NrfG
MMQGQDATPLATLALAYHRTGDHARAIATVEQALALIPDDAAQRQELQTQRAQFTAAQPRTPER